ncbi:hypothetical protein [Actinokineospora sp.]|uniref:hypothetical protein n=1 Tax=Actinokineospora sp. TaxID=1872133 RepID=UPI004037915D
MTVSLSSAAVEVVAPPDVIAEFADLTRPFFDITPADPRGRPAVLVRRTAPEGSGWRRIAFSSDYEPDRVLWVDDARRAIAVVGEPSAWRAQQLLRSVRHLLRWQAYAAGDLLLHGGLVETGGIGVAFVGGKRSGKTSSILSALLRGGADFISNDDVAITEGTAGLRGYGSPRTINIRTDSLLAVAESFPAMAELLSESSHPTNRFEGRHRTVEAITTGSGSALPGSTWVRSAELARSAGCGLVAEGRVDAVVLPRFGATPDGPRITPLDRETAGQELQEHIELQGTKYDPFLADWFPDTDHARRELLIERLLDEVAFYRMSQHMSHLSDATDLLFDVLKDRAAMARP